MVGDIEEKEFSTKIIDESLFFFQGNDSLEVPSSP